MTPAIRVAKKAGVAHKVHEYTHDLANQSYGLEAAEKLGVDPERVFKTLVVELASAQFAVALVPVSRRLSLKQFAKKAAEKKAVMAQQQDVERLTGYVLGGVSPLGQKKRLKTIINASAQTHSSIYVSAGRRGLEIELDPQDLKKLLNAEFADLCQP